MKSINLDGAIKNVEKRFGKDAIAKHHKDVPRTHSGSIKFDLAIGGGIPKGVHEIAGWESSGKSTLAIHISAEYQKAGKKVLYIDSEHAFDPFYAANIGMDTDIEKKDPMLIFSQPDTAEDCFEIAKEFIKVPEIGLVVFDSVASMLPKAVLEGEAGEQKMASLARLMSQELPKIRKYADQHDTAVIFINQFREMIGVMFGNPITRPGGNALKFYSSIRIEMYQSGKNDAKNKDSEGGKVAINSKVKVIKNKTAPPFKEAILKIEFGKGIDKAWEILDIATEMEIVEKSGSWYSYDKVKLGQGERAVLDMLHDNPELMEEIELKVRKNLGI